VGLAVKKVNQKMPDEVWERLQKVLADLQAERELKE